MSTENIFTAQDQEQTTSAVVSTTAAPESKPFNIPTEVNELVGEGKKYKSVEDALKSVPHAQTHIQRLEDEAKQLREELAKRRAAEDLLNEIKQATAPAQTTSGVEADPEVLSQIVEKVLEKKSAQQTAQQNAKTVTDKFTAVYGDKAEQIYNDIANKTGMSLASLNALSMQSPSAVLKLAGLDSNNVKTGGKLQSDVVVPPSTNQSPSTTIPRYATTKDLVNSYKAVEARVKAQYK